LKSEEIWGIIRGNIFLVTVSILHPQTLSASGPTKITTEQLPEEASSRIKENS